MKLSEAIRLGAMRWPAVHGPVVSRDENGAICGACAYGTALLAVGYYDNDECFDAAELLPLLKTTGVTSPDPRVFLNDVAGIVMMLFEIAHWSREQIADWVEQIEAQTDPHPVQTERCITNAVPV